MPLYSAKGLDKFSLKQEENRTINSKIPYQFQEKHEETLLYQEYSTNIPRIKHPRDSAWIFFIKMQEISSTMHQERDI